MVEQVFENMRKATESAVQAQQEMFRQWAGAFPGVSATQANWKDQIQAQQKKWTQAFTEIYKKQRDTITGQFEAGMKVIEEAFKVGDAKDAADAQARLVACWQKSFECLRQLAEAQVQAFQDMMAKWVDLCKPSV